MPTPSKSVQDLTLERALELVESLSVGVGARTPTTAGERQARERALELLAEWGVEARVEEFDGYSDFAWPHGLILGLGLVPTLLGRRVRRLRSALALAAGAALATEGGLRWTPISNLLARRESGNVVAVVEPREKAERTLVLMAHLDTSRSGLMFDPRFVGWLGRLITTQSAATLAQALVEPLLGRRRGGRRLLALLRLPLLLGLGLLIERRFRGVEVPGANDNASGSGVAAALASELAADPPVDTRVVLLITGCEESGTLGARAFLDRHDTEGWLFLNFDNVGGSCTLRFLRREGVLSKWDADPGLVRAAQSVAESNPELRFAPEDEPAGLTYDTTPVLARGGRGLTLSVQDGYIPDLHWPTDTYANIDRNGIERTLAAGRLIVARVAAGEADDRER